MTMNRLIARRPAELDGLQLAGVRAIYENAFPGHLRVPFEQLAETGPCDQLHIALDCGVPVGFAAVRLLDSVGWVFLRYFAIAADRRRERLGLRLWRLLQESVTADGWPGRICFEVEDPAEAGDDRAERLVREGRVGFWASCGTVPLPVPGYMMPDITPLAPPEPMLLMAASSAAAKAQGDQLARLVLAIYTERYGLLPENSLVRQALDSIAR